MSGCEIDKIDIIKAGIMARELILYLKTDQL